MVFDSHLEKIGVSLLFVVGTGLFVGAMTNAVIYFISGKITYKIPFLVAFCVSVPLGLKMMTYPVKNDIKVTENN